MTASARVQGEWLRRVEAEYRSAALTQHLALWLTQIAASPDLVRDALRIAEDELAHAELSHAAYRAAGGASAPRLDRDLLALPRRDAEPLELDVTRMGTEMFCLGETVAVPLFSHFRAMATAEAARAALDRILRDEVRHRDFGWTLLAWLLDGDQDGARRALIERELPAMLRRLEGTYGEVPSPGAAPAPDDADRAWGLAPAADYAAILARTVERDYVPRFAREGIDAAAAWASR